MPLDVLFLSVTISNLLEGRRGGTEPAKLRSHRLVVVRVKLLDKTIKHLLPGLIGPISVMVPL